MVAIVSGNTLGLINTSQGILGDAGQLGDATVGNGGENVTVNAATGNLIIAHRDQYLSGLGLDLPILRTYNSQGLMNDDNADNWRLGYSRTVGNLTGTINTLGSTVTRVGEDGASTVYTYRAISGNYTSDAGAGARDTLAHDSATDGWTWTDGDSQTTERYAPIAAGGQLQTVTDRNGNTLSLTWNGNLLASIADADGERVNFIYDTAAGKTANLVQINTVTKANPTDATATLTQTSVRYGYDSQNRLTSVTVDLTPADSSIADGNTYVTGYTYDGASDRIASVTQTDGSQLQFIYDGSGRIAQIKDVRSATDIRVTTLTYGSNQTTITDALGNATVMSYDANGQLTALTQPGIGATQYQYDTRGNVTQVTDPEGNTTVYGYDSQDNRIYESDAAGNVIERTYDTANRLLTETQYRIADPDGAGNQVAREPETTHYAYDAKGNLRFAISPEGRVTDYRYDAYGRQVSQVSYTAAQYTGSAYDTTSLTTWGAQQDQTKTDRIDTTYDFRGQVSQVTRYATTNASGAGITDGTQSSTAFIYDAYGQLLQTIDPRGVATTGTANDDVTSYTYDGLGRTLTRSQTDASSQSLTLSSTVYQDALRQSTVTLENGLTTVTTYDQSGQAISVVQTDANHGNTEVARTAYVYDTLGRTVATRITTSAGSLLSSYAIYDAAGRKVADIDAMGAMTETVYNADSQVIETIAYATPIAASALSGDPTTFTLAALRPAASPNDRTARNLYDAAGNLAKTIDAEGAVTQYQYDGTGQLVQTTQYANRLTSTQMTALAAISGDIAPTNANTIPVTDAAHDRTTRSFTSGDGLLLGTLDADGALTEYRYDGAGQRVQSIQYATPTDAGIRSTATSVDQLRPAANAGDITTTTLYNDEGQATGQIDGEGYLTEMKYDLAGNLTQTIRYANKVTTTSVIGATVDSVRPATNAADQKTLNQYDADNRLTQTQSLPDNLVTTYQYDTAGNLIATAASTGANQRQDIKRYDALGRVTAELSGENAAKITTGMTQAQIDAVWASYATKYTYDESGLLTSTTDALNRKTLYYYDNDGHQTTTINAAGEVSYQVFDVFGEQTETWRYQARLTTAQMNTLTGGMSTTALTNAINAIAPSGIVKTKVTYTLRGQIANAYDALNNNVEQRTYNAFGEVSQDATLINTAQPMRVDTFSYDQVGNTVTEQDDANNINATTQNVYDAFGRLTKTTGPTGIITNATYDRLGRTVTTAIGATGTGSTIGSKTIAYDAFGRTLTLATGDGATTYTYDDANRKVTVTTPGGISTSQTSDEFGDTVTVTDGRNNVTAYQYNRDGQVTQVTDPAGNATTQYDVAGQAFQSTDKNGVVTTYTYDAAGRLLTSTLDPTGLNIATATRYDALGEAIWQQDGNGVWTRTDYNANGQVIEVEVDPVKSPNWVSGANDNPNGLALKTTYTYDAAGNTLTVTEGAGSSNPQVTQYTYDSLGRRTKEVVDPAGLAITTQYSYDDAGNLVQTIDADNHSSDYGYDAYGRQTVTVDAAGSVTQTVYDAQSRVTQVKQFKDALTTAALATLPAIAANGTRKDSDLLALLPNGAADANYVTTQTLYNADGRQQYAIDAMGDVTQYDYDNAGNVATQTRYANAVAISAGASVSALQAALHPDATRDEVTRYVYDAADRLTWTIDAAGDATRNAYDANGNVIQSRAFATPLTAPQLATLLTNSNVGNIDALIAADSANDRVTRAVFDAAGRVQYAIDAMGDVTCNTYDKTGNLTYTLAYATQMTAAQLAALPGVPQASNITSVVPTSANDQRTWYAYDDAGRQLYEVNALYDVTANAYDALGRVASTTSYATPIASATAMNVGGIGAAVAVIANATKDQTDSFVYDAAGRLKNSTDALGNTEFYTYDGLGNKLTFTDKKGDTWTYQYDNVGRMTQETSPQVAMTTVADVSGTVSVTASGNYALVTQMQYDALGNLTARIEAVGRPETRTTLYQYDNLGRQIKTIFPTVGVYNAAADNTAALETAADAGSVARVEQTTQLSSQVFYDAFGNAVANIDVSGNISIKAYDKLGQVKYDVDALGYVTQYDHDAFGDVTALTRYANATSLIPPSISSAAGAPNAATIAALNLGQGSFRLLHTDYDLLGRATLVTEPQSYVYDPGTDTQPGIYAIAGKKTRTTYDAFGNAIKTEVSKADGTWLVTRQYFDKLNRQIATVDALNYLTENKYDAFGNLTEEDEYANAASNVTDTGYTKPTANAKDRATTDSYDRLNQKTSETQVNVQYSDTTGLTTAAAMAGITTTTGNLTTRYGYDAVGNQTFTTDANNATTYTQYDALGRVTAVIAPAASVMLSDGTTATVSPLTEFKLDAYGNVVLKTDYSRGTPGVGVYTSATTTDTKKYGSVYYTAATVDTNGQDRKSYTLYDAMGHAIETTDADGNTQYASYDAAGNLAKQWYQVTDNNGITAVLRTLFTVYQYDKLGRQIGVVTPSANAASPIAGAGPSATFKSSTAIGHQYSATTFTGANSITLTWASGLINPAGGQVKVSVSYVNGALSGGSQTQTTTAASAATGMAIVWTDDNTTQGGISSLSTITISQLNASGQWIVARTISGSAAAGAQIDVQTQAQAGVAVTQSIYNAFGEMIWQDLSTVTPAGTTSEAAQTWDYDNAGRVWRTNSGDGVTKVMLYDLQGNAVSQIVSAGVQYSGTNQASASTNLGFDLMSMQSAQQTVATILASPNLVSRTDTWYDALGRQVTQVQAARNDSNGGVTVQRDYVFANVQSVQPGGIQKSENTATLSWTPLDSLGGGDVRVVIEYAMSDGSRSTISKVIPAGQAQSGATFNWETASTTTVTAVTHVWIYKTDDGDVEQLAYESTQFGYSNNVTIDIRDPDNAATEDAAAAQVSLKYQQGSNGALQTLALTRFGDVWRASLSSLSADTYYYQAFITRPGQAPVPTDSGNFSLAPPVEQAISGLAFAKGGNGASIYAWTTPGPSVTQVFNYRIAGSGSAWQTLTVSSRSGGCDGVDVSSLPIGAYEYELLWTKVTDTAPYAHALGQFAVSPPAISGITTTNSTSGPSLSWTWPYTGGGQIFGTAVLHYRVGTTGAWNSLALTQTQDHAGQPNQAPVSVTYSIYLGSVPAGAYDVEILFTASGSSTPTARSTGTLTIGTSAVWIPGTSASTSLSVGGASGVSNISLSGNSLSWEHTYSYPAPQTPTVQYRVHGTSTWSTLAAVMTAPPSAYAPPYFIYTATLPSLAAGTYDIQLNTSFGLDGSGTLTIVAATAGYYVTRITSASFANTTAHYSASPNANPGTAVVSLPAASLLTLKQTKTPGSGTTALRPVINQTFDRWGNVLTISDPRAASWQTQYEYNADNQMIKEIQPDGNGASGNGPVSTWYFDALGRQVATRDARTSASSISVTGAGGQIVTTAINGDVNGDLYDADGNLVEEIHADGGIVKHQVDIFGDEVKQTDADNIVTAYAYDHLGHRTAVTYAPVTVYSVNAGDQLSAGVTQLLTETMQYDQAGRLIAQTATDNQTTSYRYDSQGNVIQTTVNGAVTTDAWDNQHRKIAEIDPNGLLQTWTYDAFRLQSHVDLGGDTLFYDYDNAGRLYWEHSAHGQNLSYDYDGAGQMTVIFDSAIHQTTTYAYDLAGNHTRETTVQNGIVYQDDTLGYDTLGRLRYVGTGSAQMNIDYDQVGNRTHVKTHRYLNTPDATGNFQSDDTDDWFLYDSMNRQVLVDGTASDSINATQGHELTYDANGNRTTDIRADIRLSNDRLYLPGTVIESYTYDAANRLTTITRNDNVTSIDGSGATVIDQRYYDTGGRVVQSGANLDSSYANALKLDADIHVSRYDAQGRLIHQGAYKNGRKDTIVDYSGIDAAGNVLGYVTSVYDTTQAANLLNYAVTTAIGYVRFDGYKESQESDTVSSNNGITGTPTTTTSAYDIDGNLTSITDSGQAANNRSFVNDAQGNALTVNQGGQIQRQMIVNGDVLGSYGEIVTTAGTATAAPTFTDKSDFSLGYQPINGNYPGPAPGIYRVANGDTLQGIAQGAYGDSSLWYVIAQANGIDSNNDMRIGQALTIPTRTAGVHNSSTTYKAYNPADIEGSTSPTLKVNPPPAVSADGGCGALGKALVVVVAIVAAAVVTWVTQNPEGGEITLDSIMSAFATASPGALAVGAMAGDVAAQATANAVGIQDGLDWKETAMAGIGAYVGGSLLKGVSLADSPAVNAGAHAALASAMTQGIGVATGLQDHFDWRSVVASAAGAGVGAAVGTGLQNTALGNDLGKFGIGFVAGAAAGATTSLLNGGRVSIVQVASDAFNQAMAYGYADDIKKSSDGQQGGKATAVNAQNSSGTSTNAGNTQAGNDAAANPATSGTLFASAGSTTGIVSDLNNPYLGVDIGAQVQPTATSDAVYNELVNAMQNPPAETGKAIQLDDFGNPIDNGNTAADTPTPGVINKNGKQLYLTGQDADGNPVYTQENVGDKFFPKQAAPAPDTQVLPDTDTEAQATVVVEGVRASHQVASAANGNGGNSFWSGAWQFMDGMWSGDAKSKPAAAPRTPVKIDPNVTADINRRISQNGNLSLDPKKVHDTLTDMEKLKTPYSQMKCNQSVDKFFDKMGLPYNGSPSGGKDGMTFDQYQNHLKEQGEPYLQRLDDQINPDTRQAGDIGLAVPKQTGNSPGHELIWDPGAGGIDRLKQPNNVFTTTSGTFKRQNFNDFESYSGNRSYTWYRYTPGSKQ